MGWSSLILVATAASLILFVAGALLLAALGVRRAGGLLFAPLAAFAFLGVASVLSSWIPWQPLTIALEYLVALLALFVIRMAKMRGGAAQALKEQLGCLTASLRQLKEPAKLLALGAFLLNAVLVCVFISGSVSSPEDFIHIYDNAFHYSIIRNITESLSASPFGAGCVAGAASATYPDLFHAGTALVAQTFGISIQAALWAFLLMSLMVTAPLACMLLARVLMPAEMKDGAGAVALLLPSLLGKLGALTYITFGSILSNFLGLILLPMAVALTLPLLVGLNARGRKDGAGSNVVAATSRASHGAHRGKHAAVSNQDYLQHSRACETSAAGCGLGTLLATIVACIVVLGLAHPSTVFLYGIIVVVAFVAQPMPIWKKALILVLACVVWVVLFYNPFFARTVQCLDRVSVAAEFGASVVGRLGMDYAQVAGIEMLPLAIFVVVVALSCIVAWLLRNRWNQSWYLAVLGIFIALWLTTMFPTNWFTQLVTGFWYRDNIRLREVMLYFMAILAACIPSVCLALAGRLRSKGGRGVLRGAICVFSVCVLGALGYLSWSYSASVLGDITSTPEVSDDNTVISPESDAFLQQVADIAGESVVLNDSEDASVWLYAKYGVDSVRKARIANQLSAPSDDEVIVLSRIADYASDEQVARAVDNLEIQYVVQMGDTPRLVTTESTSDDAAANLTWVAADQRSVVTDDTPGFELVLQDGTMKLYKVK